MDPELLLLFSVNANLSPILGYKWPKFCSEKSKTVFIFFLMILSFVQSHGGKYTCPYCEGDCSLQRGKMRTFGGLKKRHEQFLESGGDLKNAQKFANVINRCLLKEADLTRVISRCPIPELHIMMGNVNVHMDLLIQIFGLPFMESWTKKMGIIRHGYLGVEGKLIQ